MTPTDTDVSTVLVVDDDLTNLGVLFECLDEHRYRVLIAEDGESALAQAKQAQPDIILLDVMMPGISGFETCQRLRATPATRDIPVIFMTALTDASDKVMSFRAGAVDYVTKPFQHEELLARVENHLRIKRLQRRLQEQNSQLAREIIQRRVAEDALQRHVVDLRTSNAELDAFARTVAHDLKDPLAQMVGCATLAMEEEPLSSATNEYLDLIVQVGQRVGGIVDGLLLLAQVRDGEIVSKPVDMTQAANNARDRLAHLIREHRAELIVPQELPSAMGYEPWIEEVWSNYLSNAIKYGGHPPHIEVGADRSRNGLIRYWVRDNGVGLAPEQQRKLFTEFTRFRRSSSDGHGLGLSIVKRIVGKLGGRVEVESQLGHGSKFGFALPEVGC